ncbi:MAG: surface glycan-binding family protein, partial [Candidatus Cryptobacteroides sp.]
AESLMPGKYVFDFKLNTYIVGDDSEEGIFQNALTVDVTSGPLLLTYSPSQGKVEAGYAMRSKAPVVKGSQDGLKFHIKSVEPALEGLDIEPYTGILTIPDGNNLVVGDRYVVSVIATNFYGSKDFDDAYTISVVDFIDPITSFSYPDGGEIIQTLPVSATPEIVGEDVFYYFKEELPAELSDLQLNSETGVISAAKGNKIPVGEYSVTVVAENIKSSLEATFSFKVVENPFWFTTVRWGNNLSLEPYQDYADQFRFDKKNKAYTMSVLESDIPEGAEVKWSITKLWSQDTAEIDQEGTITLTTTTFSRPMNVLKVTVKVGGNDPAALSRDFYVFYHNYFPTPTGKYNISYTPFVLKVNPKYGATSAAAVVTDADGNDITSTFAMDFRGTFNFWCFDGKYSASPEKPAAAGSFLNSLWTQYYKGVGGANASVNTGARNPISAYDTNPTFRLGYYRQEDLRLVINADKWRDTDGWYANGLFLGETQVDNNGKTDPVTSNGPRTFTIWVWFDTEFDNE